MLVYGIIFVLVLGFLIVLCRYYRLKKQIKSMSRQLSEQVPDYHSLSIELLDHDLEQLTLKINQLTEGKKQVQIESDKSKNYLKNAIADISHDMRTPLTSSIGYMQLLKRSALEEDQAQHLQIALDKSIYLRNLLTDFFELSIIDANNTEYEKTKVDLAGIVSEVILGFYNEFTEKQIEPVFARADYPVFIMGHAGLLYRVIQNIISNSLKHSCGNVTFHIEDSDAVQLTVENPVDKAKWINVDKIFDRFYKEDSSRNKEGAGLGLSITKLLVEKMDGSISATLTQHIIRIQVTFPKYYVP